MKIRSRFLKSLFFWLLAPGDLLMVLGGFYLSFVLRFGGHIPAANWHAFLRVLPWTGLAALLFFAGLGLYRYQYNGLMPVLRAAVTGILGVMAATMALTFWLRGFAFPRSVLVLAMPLQGVLVCTWRYLYWHVHRWFFGRRELLVVGPPEEAAEILGKVLDLPRGWFRVHCVLPPERLAELPGRLREVDAVLVVPSLARGDKADILNACLKARREVFLVPDLYDIMLSRAGLTQLDDLPVVEVQDIRLTWPQRMVKRVVDVALAGLGLILLSPVMLVCALAVRFTSPGPVLYIQERAGLAGRPFRLYKFRTMVEGAEKLSGPVLAEADDPRITPAGRFLRATRLDELPQLFNVFRGDMSIVGPRPERPVFVAQFMSEIPDYRYRHLVKPGLTGLAQVSGKYTTAPADKLRYDLYYIRNYSLLLDLKILLQTIPVALGGEAARGYSNGTDPVRRAAIHALVNGSREAAAGKEAGKL
ncbi:sugar transferase [Desulfotomaculum copahuensis]|uniref:sugar transferase n=1 Tax=Desulfotomaculum copahuensis TaxID=1838280 RepID=UPI00137337DA|nr:sugar transferase [Desulfotomaculum copahuensis]